MSQRPRAKSSRDKRQPLGLRVSPVVREALEAASQRSGRSLSHEAELCLELALRDQRSLADILDVSYGFQASALLLLIGDVIQSALELDWINDPASFESMRLRVDLIFQMLSPGKPPADTDYTFMMDRAREVFGRLLARAPHPYYRDWARERWLRLGNDAVLRATMWQHDQEKKA